MKVNEASIETELNLINGRIIIALIIIVSVSLTALIGYNEKLKLTGRQPFWNASEVRNIAIILRIALLISAIAAVYFCLTAIEVLKEKKALKNDIDAGYFNFYASIFGIGAAILALIAISKSTLEEEELIANSISF